ncbi:MAG: PEP/pyruvate-binding domain-containing protein [Acidobacteria bacterium]|nr:PEP/pyruvate-binding domain-containing protein [Acidobacteriota bacterium]
MPGTPKNKPEWKVIIDLLLRVDDALFNRIIRRMIYHLYSKQIKAIDDLMSSMGQAYTTSKAATDDLYTNVPEPKKDKTMMAEIVDKIFQIASEHLPEDEITDRVRFWLAQERTRFLAISFENSSITLITAIDEITKFFNIPKSEIYISPEEFMAIRTSLIRRFLSLNLHYINIAKQYLTVRDFRELLTNIIGPPQGIGRLGGKSAGLILAEKILDKAKYQMTELADIKVPKSWYVTSDTLMDFIHFNALEEVISIKYLDSEQIRAGYPYITQLFKNCFWSTEIARQFATVLDEVGDKPIIVRSSSLLEDSFEAAFSGKYKSLFLSNNGTKEERLIALLDAAAEIYASVFAPDPMEYRKERGFLDFQEEMGLLIQEVVGNRIGNYFAPSFAGVAFSNNEFRWSPRIKLRDGATRLVAGLGTRAVDRVGDDYPFLASPGKPNLEVNITYEDKIRYSQKKIDVINMKTGKFETRPIDEIFHESASEMPWLDKIVSVDNDRILSVPFGVLWNPDESDLVVTFEGLIKNTNFMKQMKTILKVLEDALDTPVDVEFAHDGKNLFILQCRPQMASSFSEEVHIPNDIKEERILFTADKYVTNGLVKNIEYVVYVDHDEYLSLQRLSDMKRVAETISKLNKALPKRRFILMGPGRWGSRGDIKLGVAVTYSDINCTSMLIEIAYARDGYVPELSFGTHFFQDLVESNIKYLPLYPGEGKNILSEKWFKKYPNKLEQFSPDHADMKDVIKVIDICDIVKNSRLEILMNGKESRAVGYIKPERKC